MRALAEAPLAHGKRPGQDVRAIAVSHLASAKRPRQPATMEPGRRAVEIPCDVCNGMGRRPSEWDIATGAAVAYRPCCRCLGVGRVLANAPARHFGEVA